MSTVTLDELSRDTGRHVKRAAAGETLIVTENERPLAELRPASSSRASAQRPKGMSGSEFVARFAGLIPPDEMDLIDRAIEADCERIEPDAN